MSKNSKNNSLMTKYPQVVTLGKQSLVIQPTTGDKHARKNQRKIIVLVLGLIFAFVLGTVPFDLASAFTQGVLVHLNQGIYSGQYGLILTNMETDLYTTEYYTTPYVEIEGYISASYGDRLQACVMDMSTEDMACDYGSAFSPNRNLNFYVNMNDATSTK